MTHGPVKSVKAMAIAKVWRQSVEANARLPAFYLSRVCNMSALVI